MAYATVAELRAYLTQVPAGAANDATLQTALDRATAIVDVALQLGASFAAYGDMATAKDVQARGVSYWLELPVHEQGSVTTVYEVSSRGLDSESTDEIDEFVEEDDGRLYYGYGWTAGAWYRVSAKWGLGAAPAEVVEVTLQLAVNLWQSQSSGRYSDIVGVEGGGAVGYARALTNQQRLILDGVRVKYLGVVFG